MYEGTALFDPQNLFLTLLLHQPKGRTQTVISGDDNIIHHYLLPVSVK
jgi:hypothetical protein